MGYIKELDGFDLAVKPFHPSITERRKICRYIDKLRKQDKIFGSLKKKEKAKNNKLGGKVPLVPAKLHFAGK